MGKSGDEASKLGSGRKGVLKVFEAWTDMSQFSVMKVTAVSEWIRKWRVDTTSRVF